MNVLIITQDEPFYLGQHFDTLFQKMPSWATILGVILLSPSPFGKSGSFINRIKKTYSTFGIRFFLRYCFQFIRSKTVDRRYLILNVMRRHEIPRIQLPHKNLNAKINLEALEKLGPDVIVSITANQIFKKKLLNLPKYGCINLHSALLPFYKGLMPTFWALKNDEREMGVSVFFMDEGIDTGGILVQERFEIESGDSLESLIHKNKNYGMKAIIKALELIRSQDYQTKKFSPEEGSYYSFPTRQEVKEFLHAGKKFW